MKETLTDWFPPEVKPVYVGYFHTGERNCDPSKNKSDEKDRNLWWNGAYWMTRNDGLRMHYKNRYWRGRTKP